MSTVHRPLAIGSCTIPNRLYRAPLLECAGNGPDMVDRLIDELEPTAEAGAGLIFQGATVVTEHGGCVAPGMTRVADPSVLERCERLTDQIHEHGSRLFIQLDHGGVRSLETWHAGYRAKHPTVTQSVPSRPPWFLRALDQLGFLALNVSILETDEVFTIADEFAQAAGAAVDAGYDGIHLAAANMGLIEQFCSPRYNRRDDEFGRAGGGPRPRFLTVLHDTIRAEIGDDVPLVTKIPAENAAPSLLGPRLTIEDGVDLASHCERVGYDAVVPVTGTGFWDASIVRGSFPARAWTDRRFQSGYDDAFGGPFRRRIVQAANRLQAWWLDDEPAWNSGFAERVADAVDIPVGIEGGIRERSQIDRLLDDGIADFVGMGRPFYAEPRLPQRVLADTEMRVLCENCNNCTVPQVTGARGVCRTPSVLAARSDHYEAGSR